ncbi:HesA/MoeB/ThiF family protein [Cytophaga sp. FL35]|uniref:HesA/MoeB/ThiF family protein n=1 Tax=Cytophaga sp. FL35 TaxID=1904456 RepID=UPI0016537119|nr:HesA/MoeB/ThiF family protein [Cytophaga sp. FL35]MBC6997903.1 HesA/MoeB/ThiF family protein [Cytophaga sp. FL35]
MERYQRQVILPGFGEEAQQKLQQAKVLVIGAGGLGIPVLTYLNSMGVGTLGIVDNDLVSITNLHRQVAFAEKDVNQAKVTVLARKLSEQNSDTKIIEYPIFLNRENALDLIQEYDLVVDASDNFPTRYLVNDACVMLNKPFIYGALHGFEGQVSVFNHNGGPTYRCLFPTMPKSDEVPNCNDHGVLGILPGIVGNLQALEAVKVITALGEALSGKLLLFDALGNTFQKIKFGLRTENLEIRELQSSYDFDCEVGVNEISAENFSNLMETDEIQLIDVRTEKEFARNHLSVAKNIPLGELESRLGEIDFNSTAYLLCQSGIRSKKAIAKLQELQPLAQLVNVTGGMNQIRLHAAEH